MVAGADGVRVRFIGLGDSPFDIFTPSRDNISFLLASDSNTRNTDIHILKVYISMGSPSNPEALDIRLDKGYINAHFTYLTFDNPSPGLLGLTCDAVLYYSSGDIQKIPPIHHPTTYYQHTSFQKLDVKKRKIVLFKLYIWNINYTSIILFNPPPPPTK